MFVWGRVYATILSYFNGLDQGCSQCPTLDVVLYGLGNNSVKKVSVTLLFYLHPHN